MLSTWLRRSFREIRQNALRYGAVFLLVAGATGVMLAIQTSSGSVITTVEGFRSAANIEDGEFETRAALSDTQLASLKDRGATLEAQPWTDSGGPADSTVRLQPVRDTINKIQLSEGRLPVSSDDLVLEKLYANAHGLVTGDSIQLAGRTFTITGIGSTPDYSYVIPSVTSSSTTPESFGTAFVTHQGFDAVATGNQAPTYSYAYRLTDSTTSDELRSQLLEMTVEPDEISNPALRDTVEEQQDKRTRLDDAVKSLAEGARAAAAASPGASESLQSVSDAQDGLQKYLDETATVEIPMLADFQPADTNPRIITVTNDAAVNRTTALFAGVLVLLLAAYVLTAFAIDNLEQDSASIGALSAIGLRPRELMFQYLMPPLVVVMLACVVGTLVGSLGAQAFNDFAQLTAYYSVPSPSPQLDFVMLLIGLVAAPVLVAIVVSVQLRHKLSTSPLDLLRRTPSQKVGGKGLSLTGWSFGSRFRTRQALRESRSYVIMAVGLLLAVILMVFGFGMQNSISAYESRVSNDLKFDNMYMLQVPETDVPEGAEPALATSLAFGDEAQADVTLLGVSENSRYFDFTLDEASENDVAVSDGLANRYGLQKGDTVFLTDPVKGASYRVTVSQIVPYSAGLYLFQPIADTRKLLGEADDYYNVALSTRSLNFSEGRVGETVTRADVVRGAERTVRMTTPIVSVLVILSIAVFCIVLTLFIRMMIDRDTYSIALMKSFGYREGEIAKLYLNNYTSVAALSLVLGIPLGLVSLTPVWRTIISSIPMGAPFQLGWTAALTIIGIIALSYVVVYIGARIKLARIEVTEILRDRE